MRRKENRTNQILELLVKEKKLEVAELSTQLGVSQVTIRKDLDSMEAQGLITREHGSAVLASTDREWQLLCTSCRSTGRTSKRYNSDYKQRLHR